MKVLLVQPPSYSQLMDQAFMFEPLALEYLGAGVRLDGHEVRLVDGRIDPHIEKVVRAFEPDVVGLTAYTSQVNIVRDLAARLREWRPSAFVVVGGHHATVRPEDFATPAIDAVVIGEGVFTLREILSCLQEKRDLSDIRGLGLPTQGTLAFTEPRPYTALDDLPTPDRSLTAPYRDMYFSEWFKPLASVRTSLGCAARCNFCALWSITGGKYLRRDPDSVVAELATVAERNIFFCDDESMWDTRRMAVLAEKIRAAGIRKRYFLYARVDTISRHPDLFAQWADIGLAQVFVGMEDFSDQRLAAMNKGATTDQQQQAVKILDRLGVMMYASFMVDPAYTREDFRALVAYIRKLGLQYATFTVMTPLPGTQLHRDRASEILSTKPELYDMLHALLPTRLPLAEFYEEFARLWTGTIPLHRSLSLVFKFGLHGFLLKAKMFSAFLRRLRTSHLDYVDNPGPIQEEGRLAATGSVESSA